MEAIASVLRPAFRPYTLVDAINETCDSLIRIINVRRRELLDLIEVREKELADIKTCRERAHWEYIHADRLYQAIREKMWYSIPLPESFQFMLYKNAFIKERRAYGVHKLSVKCNKDAFRSTLKQVTDVYLEVLNPEIMKYKQETPELLHGIIGTGAKGSSIGEYNSARCIAYDGETQEIFIADCANSRVVICSETGTYLSHFGDSNLLGYPQSIAITPQFIYTGDIGLQNKPSKEMYKFSRTDYQLLAHTALEPGEEVVYPCNIAIHNNTDVYVCDVSNHRISIYSGDLVFREQFTHEQLQKVYVSGVILKSDTMYVLVDGYTYCVLIFINAQYVQAIIRSGAGVGQVDYGIYFTMDKCNNIIISDHDAHCIKIFSPRGKLLNSIGKEGKLNKGELYEPLGVCVTNAGNIFCVNNHNKYCIQNFRYSINVSVLLIKDSLYNHSVTKSQRISQEENES